MFSREFGEEYHGKTYFSDAKYYTVLGDWADDTPEDGMPMAMGGGAFYTWTPRFIDVMRHYGFMPLRSS
ncbi:hypothetical protein FACS1894187_04440 [Synergistales bacterium]|nr:hypothetical protein FACS1894187_04440 [Synergistales bacterium]